MSTKRRLILFGIGAACFAALPASALTFYWAPVLGAGNACDSQSQGCFGGVASGFLITETEVTNEAYAEFLNAVADADPNAVYNPSMAGYGITRSGSPGSYVYTAAPALAQRPVVFVSYYDSLRFTNWLQNGQPIGAQGPGTTEGGSYVFAGPSSVGLRLAGANIFLPSENEWYKAAYYDPVSSSYFDFPTSSNAAPVCSPPTATPNRANCQGVNGGSVSVLSYPKAFSPNGTFDQGGNVAEWNEQRVVGGSTVVRGGDWAASVGLLAASAQTIFGTTTETPYLGFRVASVVPEPGTALLTALGLCLLARRQAAR